MSISISQLIQANSPSNPISASHGDFATVRDTETGNVTRFRLVEIDSQRRCWIDLDSWEIRKFSVWDSPVLHLGQHKDIVLTYPKDWESKVREARRKGGW